MSAEAPSPPNSSPISKAPAQNARLPGTTTPPKALTAASAPTVAPLSVTIDAEPRPPISVAVIAPVPAPAVPSSKSSAAASNASAPSAG